MNITNVTNVMVNTSHNLPVTNSTIIFGVVVCAISTLFQAFILILM